jgi:GntR family transcriptional regulator, arabinose operon transcriptional repressor
MARKINDLPLVPKYRQVFEALLHEILSGKYPPGQKFPSEAALVKRFGTSRITVGRALRELSQRGLVERVAGSGTFVGHGHVSADSMLFGLLIPDLGTSEIFEPICQGIAGAQTAGRHGLLWGQTAGGAGAPAEEQALGLCQQFLASHVAGVFFAPLERGPAASETNRSVVARLEEARVPIVLLDRSELPYPERSRHDLVGIDNRRAARLAVEYLVGQGAGQISFVAYEGGAATVDARIAGFRESWENGAVHRVEEITAASMGPLLKNFRPGDGFLCANDRTAGEFMKAVLSLGYRVPEHLRIVGIDDVEYSHMLPVPLTTVRQPCREIGEAAMETMLSRIANPQRPGRDVLVECRLVVRESA